ncbi:MAG: FAD-dependent oxidoreductase [Caldilineaceae bacterium]
MTQYKYLIVGGGMAANAAIQGIRSLDRQGSIGVITAEADPPYDRPPLSKGLWKGDTSLDEIVHPASDGVIFHHNRRAEMIHIAQRMVEDDQAQGYEYEKLLLATGGTPKRLPFDQNGEILYYRTLQDYHRLRELSEQYDRFAVIGGSFIGSELAAALALNGKEVSMIFPEGSLCAQLLPPDVSGYLNRYYESKGVRLNANTPLKGMEGKLGNYLLHTAFNEEISAEVVVAGIGIQPNTELAERASLRVGDGVMVNTGLQTSDPDIYAAGDIANFEDALLKERRRVEHEDNAKVMGEAAGRAMTGAKIDYTHSPMFYSDLFDIGYEAVGKLGVALEVYADWQDEYAKGVIYYLDAGRLRGVLLWNVWDQLDRARELIRSNHIWQLDELQGQIA